MTENKIIKKLAEKYVEIWKRYKKTNAYNELEEKRLEAQIDLLDDIFGDFFSIENLYITDDGCLRSGGERVGE